MTSSRPGDDSRTEIIHDVDHPLDVPTASADSAGAGSHSTATRAFPAAGAPLDTPAPLPFGEQPTTIEPRPREEISRRGTTDLGLFLLRLVVGLLLAARGLQKLFGLLDGPGVDGFTRVLSDAGFEQARLLAITGGAVELVAGLFLVLGLATPVVAAALLGLVGLGVVTRLAGPEAVPVLGDTVRGLETSLLYGAALLTLLFAGPGRWSADRRWRWSHRPRFSGIIWLVLALLAAGAVWYLLNGTNPLTGAADGPPVTAGE